MTTSSLNCFIDRAECDNSIALSLQREQQITSLEILYQQDGLIVVDKPFDILINSDDSSRNTVSSLLARLTGSGNDQLGHQFYIVHRLDYSTSGVFCVALSKSAARAFSTHFQTKRVRKYYLAFCHGHIRFPTNERTTINRKSTTKYLDDEDETPPSGEIDIAICSCSESVHRMQACIHGSTCPNHPRQALTHYTVIEYGRLSGDPVTKLLLRPYTGRRHQLRVHLAHIGHRIVGDYTYSNGVDMNTPRMYLHAQRIIFPACNVHEEIDIATADPFTADLVDAYETSCVINNLKSLM